MSSIAPKSIPMAAPVQTLGNGYLNGTFYLPEELMSEIFLHLPVKHLLRIRCVCKVWCHFIDSTSFVKRHLQRSIECSPDSRVILRSCPEGDRFFLADLHSLCDSPAVEIDDPVKTYLSGAEFIGSCNGVVCLLKNNNYDILLWNPTTRKCREVPRTKIALPFRLMESSILGFGYDRLNDDYKVMRIPGGQIWGQMVTVYSLKNNSWTQPGILTNEIHIAAKCGTYANGSLYWLTTKNSPIIFSFDLGVERHKELPLPAGLNKTDENHMGLTVFDKSLCIFELSILGSHTDIWVMNDNRVDNSWSKLISVEQPGICRSINVVPVAFLKTRKDFLLVAEDDTFMWYNRVNNEVKNVKIDGFPDSFDMLVYTESLVQLLSYDFNLDGKESEETKKESTTRLHEEITEEDEQIIWNDCLPKELKLEL